MSEKPSKHLVVVVDDDPGSARRIQSLLSSLGRVQTRFADTINAVTRTLESERASLVAICANEENLALIEPIAHQCRKMDVPIPLVVGVDLEAPDQALAAVEAGVDGVAPLDDDKLFGMTLRRNLEHARAHREAEEHRQRLEEIESRYTLLLDSSREALAYVHQGLHIYCNGAYMELFGYERFEDVEGLSMLDLFSAGDKGTDLKAVLRGLEHDDLPDDSVPVVAHRADGEVFKGRITFSPARYNSENCIQMMVREEVTQADPGLEKELEKLRTTDSVTGLINRTVFMERIAARLGSGDGSEQAPGETAVLFVELTDHAALLSKVGMGSADALVQQAAMVVSHQAGDEDVVSRVRENTFALLVTREDRDSVETLARHLLEAYSGHILQVKDLSLTVSGAVGITYIGQRTRDAEEILHQADDALSEALRAGGNCFVRYRPRIEGGEGEADDKWAERIRHALDNNEFMFVEQPVLDMENDESLLVKVEPRLRPDGGEEVYLPETYLDPAVRAGLGTSLDQDLAGKLATRLSAGAEDQVWLLPLSSASVSSEGFQQWLQEQVESGNLPGQRLVLQFRDTEIREALLDTQRFIQRFAARGCRFSLAGVDQHTPLGQLLKHLDLDFLELLGETTDNLSADEDRRRSLEDIVATVRERNIRIIAPRVHNTNDMASLWQFGITLVQGDFENEDPALQQAG